jgi:hypothetical protein
MMNVTFWRANTVNVPKGQDVNKRKVGECNIENGKRPVWILGDESLVGNANMYLRRQFNRTNLSDWRELAETNRGTFHWMEIIDES